MVRPHSSEQQLNGYHKSKLTFSNLNGHESKLFWIVWLLGLSIRINVAIALPEEICSGKPSQQA